MTELQFLLLKYYFEGKSINTHEVHAMFLLKYPQFTLEQLKKEMQYLHGSLFIDSTPGQFNTLGITKQGEEKFKLEEFGVNQRRRFGESKVFQERFLPIKKPLQNANKYRIEKIKKIITHPLSIWIAKYISEIIIGGIIAGLLTVFIIMKYHIPH